MAASWPRSGMFFNRAITLTILQRVTRYIHFCVDAAASENTYNRPTTRPALRLRSKSALDIKKKNKLFGKMVLENRISSPFRMKCKCQHKVTILILPDNSTINDGSVSTEICTRYSLLVLLYLYEDSFQRPVWKHMNIFNVSTSVEL